MVLEYFTQFLCAIFMGFYQIFKRNMGADFAVAV